MEAQGMSEGAFESLGLESQLSILKSIVRKLVKKSSKHMPLELAEENRLVLEKIIQDFIGDERREEIVVALLAEVDDVAKTVNWA